MKENNLDKPITRGDISKFIMFLLVIFIVAGQWFFIMETLPQTYMFGFITGVTTLLLSIGIYQLFYREKE